MCRQALRKIEVVSPNHMELASFFGLSGTRLDNDNSNSGAVDRETIEKCATEWLSSGIGLENGPGAIVVRAGREGCYIATRKQARWLPAYFSSPERVKDPTGGGNAFLGGLAVALARDKSLLEGAIWGSIAASFAIEQVGMPVRSVGPDGKERWNGDRVAERLDHYLQRL
jgi:sugar/nucleoside kinase (ribokinase family)